MNNLTSQATWDGLGVPLPKDFQIQSPLYHEIDKLNRANNDAFIVVLTLCFILGFVLINNAHQTKQFEFYMESKDPTP
jgi:hypothetical protein